MTSVFNQYLRYTSIPKLEFRNNGTKNQFEFAWNTNEPNFEMPIDVIFKNKKVRLMGTNKWQKLPFKMKYVLQIEVLKNKFYVKSGL